MKTSCALNYFRSFLLLIVLLISCSVFNTVEAQTDTTAVWEIQTNDDNKYYGKIVSEDDSKVVIKTETLGEITIQKTNIRSQTEVSKKRFQGGQYWGLNRQANRYFWAPNAFNLKKGEGYYQNVWVFFNQVSYGFTDEISMGVGIVPLFLFDAGVTPIWFTPKISFPIKEDKFSLGGGVLAFTVIGDELDNPFAGIAYGVGTLGNRDANLSLGVGYGFAGGGWADSPTITFSGMIRVNRRTYVMSENYLIGSSGDNFFFSLIGGRTVWDNISLDYGLVIPVSADTSGFIGIPWLGLVVPFGQGK